MTCVDFMFFRDFSSPIYHQHLITSPMEVGDIHKDHTESSDMWNVKQLFFERAQNLKHKLSYKAED